MTAPPSLLSQTVAPVCDWMAGRQALDRGALPSYVAILLLASFAAIAVMFLGFDYDRAFAINNTLALGTFLGFAIIARWLGFPRLGSVLEAWVLLLAVSALTALAAFIAAAANLPLVDDQLAWIDYRIFGFSRDALTHFPTNWPRAFHFTAQIYNTLSYQPFALLAVLFALGHRARAWMFLLAWSLALVLCLAVSPFMPARGTPPYILDWIDVFYGARDGTMRTLSTPVLTGIITFPSFHAAGAVTLAWAAASVRALRFPMIALNAMVVVSAVLVGGHYIVDVVAGIAVAAAAIVAASRLQPLSADWLGGSSRPGTRSA